MGLDVCSSAVRDVQGTLGASIQMKYKEYDEQLTNKGDLPPRDCFRQIHHSADDVVPLAINPESKKIVGQFKYRKVLIGAQTAPT